MIPGSLLFRADASIAMGTGHAMRCLALAQAWQDAGGSAIFAMAAATPAIRERLRSEACQVLSLSAPAGTQADAEQTIAGAREKLAAWLVVDGYQFGADYLQTLKKAGLKILFVDDYSHVSHYSVDVVLNQNVSAGPAPYDNREPYTRLLLGPQYSMLRREFNGWRNWTREIRAGGRRVLVTMGGSDPDNLTGRIIESLTLTRLEDIEAMVVVGGSNPHFDSLLRSAAQCKKKIILQRDVSDMAERIAWADVGISAAGSTCWELCRLGLPALLIDAAENQRAIAKELHRRGCAIHLGEPRDVSAEKVASQLESLLLAPQLRSSLSRCSRELVDGHGAQRIVSILSGRESLYVRRARSDDSRLLWDWANDPGVRSASFSPQPISWEAHARWFEEKLQQSQCLILIAEDETGKPLGQIRFDRLESGPESKGDAEVDISIAAHRRGGGLAPALLELGVQALVRERGSVRVHAFVKPANAPSLRAFEKANFIRVGAEQVRGNAAIHLIRGGNCHERN